METKNTRDRSALEDEWIAVRCQLGERAAFDMLIRRWHEPLWQYVRRQSGNSDTACEIMQDVWIRVLRGIARLREPSKLRAWLFGIARRTWLDRLRQRYAEPKCVDLEGQDIAAEVVAEEIEGELIALERELDRLPPVERETLVLFYLRELSLHQIAEVLEIPVGTVKSRLFRARNVLRQQLERQELEKEEK